MTQDVLWWEAAYLVGRADTSPFSSPMQWHPPGTLGSHLLAGTQAQSPQTPKLAGSGTQPTRKGKRHDQVDKGDAPSLHGPELPFTLTLHLKEHSQAATPLTCPWEICLSQTPKGSTVKVVCVVY